MNRIMVMGVSAGVGKSTFARQIGKKLDITVYHLDALYWEPNWVETSLEAFSARQREIVVRDKWIIEGNYSNTYNIRAEKAETIIYLELPLFVCLFRVFKRWILHIGKTRPDMGKDCKEKIDAKFIRFICSTYTSRKRKMKARLQSFQQSDSQKNIIILKGKKEIQLYLDSLSN